MKINEYRKLNNPLAHCAVIVGIDPGVNTGVAIGSHEDPTLPIIFQTLDFWGVYDKVAKYNPDHTGIVIEVANAKRVMYLRVDGNSDAGRVRENMAAKIGSNRREAELLASRFEAMGFPVVRVTPTRTKWDADELKRRTGITARTNEHVRDAIRLVWERIN